MQESTCSFLKASDIIDIYDYLTDGYIIPSGHDLLVSENLKSEKTFQTMSFPVKELIVIKNIFFNYALPKAIKTEPKYVILKLEKLVEEILVRHI